MRIAVVDGQGGGIGKHIAEKLRRVVNEETEIIALGTNALATAAMLKAGANEGATGENAVIYTVKRVDIIVGSVSLLVANSMWGEISPRIAVAIGEASARKILLPINRSGVEIIGVEKEPLPHQIDELVTLVKKYEGEKNV